ncbi:MAG: MG2 domain-containing protein [Spirochaetia bacterium]
MFTQKKAGFLLWVLCVGCILFFSGGPLFGERPFYLSTDRSFAPGEGIKIRVESSRISTLKIRVYKIKDPTQYFLTQDNIHRPKVRGRSMRYFAPEVFSGFEDHLRVSLRHWARRTIPALNRGKIMETYPEFARKSREGHYNPKKTVNYINDKNFSLAREEECVLEERGHALNVNYVFLNSLLPGTYLIEGINGRNVAYTVLNIAEFGFIVKKAGEDCLVYTVNNKTAEPLAGVELTVYNRFNRKVGQLRSDNNGLARARLAENDIFIVGRSPRGEYAFYDPNYFPSTLRDNNVYMYTERPVYRGGDTVYFKGIYRNYKQGVYSATGAGEIGMTVIDGRGNRVQTFTVNSDNLGIFSGEFALPKDAVSGRYTLLARIDGKEYEAEFKVEYYKKPEFKVEVTTPESAYIGGAELTANVSGLYYFGEPLAGATVHYSVYRTRFADTQWMKDQAGGFYVSEQEYVYSRPELIESRDARLDGKGKLSLQIKTRHENDPFTYRIEAAVVSDTGTRVTGSTLVKVYPAAVRLGISTDKFVYLVREKVNVEVRLADIKGMPLAGKVKVTATSGNQVIGDDSVNTSAKGGGVFRFSARSTGFVKVLAQAQDKDGNTVKSEKYLWIGEEGASYQYSGGLIKLVLDKSSYKTGERAKLLVISPVPEVKFLLTVEGDIIYSHEVKKLSGNSALIEIPLYEKYIPNVFVDVSFIFNNRFYNNSIKISIPPEQRFLNIDIKPEKKVYEPGQTGSMLITVTDNKNRPVAGADLSLSVVDEAIYGISNEIAVDIRKFFYPFRRNNVMTWSSIGFRFYGYAMDVYSELAQRFYRDPTGLAAFKGGEAERKDFKDTILWIPSLKTDSRGQARAEVKFPDNITQWRATVVGITGDTLVGRATGSVITKLDFFTDISLPSYLDEKDRFSIYNSVYNYTDKSLKTTLTMKADKAVIAEPLQTVTVEPHSSTLVQWDLTAAGLGEASFTLQANAGRYKDTITKKVTIIPHSIMKAINVNAKLDNRHNSMKFTIPEKMKKGSQTLEVNVSYGYASVILESLDYLIKYPYGCVEQTTSSFLPNLVAVNALNKTGLHNPRYETQLAKNIEHGLAKLYGFQLQDGSWGWFGGGDKNLFMTSYVLYALTLTGNLGYEVDTGVLSRGLAALGNRLGNARNDTEKVYALYVLSLNAKKYESVYSSLKSREKDLNPYSLALLALTALNYNKTADALDLVGRLKYQVKKDPAGKLVYWGDSRTTSWYKDDVETTAWVLRALIKVDPRADLIPRAVDWLFFHKDGRKWKSTRDTAAAIFALSDLLAARGEKEKQAGFDLKLNNTKLGRIEYTKNSFTTMKRFSAAELKGVLRKANTLSIEGINSDQPLLVSLSFSYYTDDNLIAADSSGIRITRTYYELKENRSYSGKIEYTKGEVLSSFETGKNVLVEIEFGLNNREDYVLIEDYFPSGCTPVKDFKLSSIRGYSNSGRPDYVDFRDEKVAFFYSRAGSHKIYYVLRPVFEGSYEVMPATASLMYFPSVRGNSTDSHVSIK